MRWEQADDFHVRAAWGWLGLEDWASASDELWQVAPALREDFRVLLARHEVLITAEKWDAALPLSEKLLKMLPEDPNRWIDRSHVLGRLKRPQEAYDLLLPALRKFPMDGLIPCNLVGYCAVLGRRKEAWQWLQWAFQVGDVKETKGSALTDPDLEPFWPEIAKITVPVFPIARIHTDLLA